ncbi:MAG: carbon-nitrogen hydrolase family protein [Alphaproteobacteria bacterium]
MTETKLIAACIQLNSGADIAENLKAAGELIRQAAAQGARFIATPEVTDQVISNRAEKIDQMLSEADHPGLAYFSALAKELGVYLLIGSMCIRIAEDKMVNRSFLIADTGEISARYDKIHMYDVDLPTGESHRESKVFQPGTAARIADIQGGFRLGLSICYDLRFPHLFRDLAKAGANILSIPAAFTVPTGQAHWDVLLRARAIECGAFVIAPAQCGDHQGARKTYGHSMIVSPWGEILAQMNEGTGYALATLDLEAVTKARQAIPALMHDRAYIIESD